MTIWVLTDDRAGNRAQALGVAEAAGMPFEQIEVSYTTCARLPNILRGASLWGVSSDTRAHLMAHRFLPSLVIAAGRRTAPVARWIKSQAYAANKMCALCQIMDPGWAGRRDFDVVAVPKHDRSVPTGDNILLITGAPHRLTQKRLYEEKERWETTLGTLSAPRVAVLVGGKTKEHGFSETRAAALGRSVRKLSVALGGQVMVTTSRRTGDRAEGALFAELPDDVWAYRWTDGQKTGSENPYFGFLAWADILVVTGDSMSMASEACGTDKPVIIESPDGMVSAKHKRLHDVLVQEGRAMYLTEKTEGLLPRLKELSCTPINPAHSVVEALRSKGYL